MPATLTQERKDRILAGLNRINELMDEAQDALRQGHLSAAADKALKAIEIKVDNVIPAIPDISVDGQGSSLRFADVYFLLEEIDYLARILENEVWIRINDRLRRRRWRWRLRLEFRQRPMSRYRLWRLLLQLRRLVDRLSRLHRHPWPQNGGQRFKLVVLIDELRKLIGNLWLILARRTWLLEIPFPGVLFTKLDFLRSLDSAFDFARLYSDLESIDSLLDLIMEASTIGDARLHIQTLRGIKEPLIEYISGLPVSGG